jgi:hypothetical protein
MMLLPTGRGLSADHPYQQPFLTPHKSAALIPLRAAPCLARSQMAI